MAAAYNGGKSGKMDEDKTEECNVSGGCCEHCEWSLVTSRVMPIPKWVQLLPKSASLTSNMFLWRLLAVAKCARELNKVRTAGKGIMMPWKLWEHKVSKIAQDGPGGQISHSKDGAGL